MRRAAIVGRENTIHLQASSVSCIDRIMVRDPAGKELEAEWKAVRPDEVEVKLPLQAAQPGQLTLSGQTVRREPAAAGAPASFRGGRSSR